MTAKTPSGLDFGVVLILPLARRTGRVREVVDRYDRLSGAAAASYQNHIIRQERAALRALGLHADGIDRELHGFNQAVQRERWRRRHGDNFTIADEASGGAA